jgi:hypothetical protein
MPKWVKGVSLQVTSDPEDDDGLYEPQKAAARRRFAEFGEEHNGMRFIRTGYVALNLRFLEQLEELAPGVYQAIYQGKRGVIVRSEELQEFWDNIGK